MRKRYQLNTTTPHEFELDLAPLLAVMVKLVPVLLISSSFMQLMMIESDLPQVVKAAIEKNQQDQKRTIVQLEINKKKGITLIVEKNGRALAETIPNQGDGSFDFLALNKKLEIVKSENPEVFRIELLPAAEISYKEIVHVMDETRRARDKSVKFPVFDATLGKQVETDYMFPDVVFANVVGG